jgi:hypothetical protein
MGDAGGEFAVRSLRCVFVILVSLSIPAAMAAQKVQRKPLSDTQIEEIREAGVDPNARISLYTKYLDERSETIKGLTNRKHSTARAVRIDNELQDFTALMDELASNLDQYSDRKADMRAGLKKLNESAPKWVSILKILEGEPTFDEARKEAIESGEDLADDAHRLLQEQTDYFNLHKDERGQQRAEPK